MNERGAWPGIVERIVNILPWLLGLWLMTERALSDGIIETGDGVQHYMIARYSWVHPLLFLDNWGKPLFVLLASPFAQFGHAGVALFNVICAMVMAFAGMRVLKAAGLLSRAAFPVLVILAPLYVQMVLGGMTEILFGTVALCAVSLLVSDRPVAAAVVASFTPFARPEYVAFLPMIALWLAWERRWKAMVLCAIGLVLYAVVGWGALGDPLWFWTRDPYTAIGVYGSGDGMRFLIHAEEVFGRPLLTLCVAATVLWPLIQWKDHAGRRTHRMLLVVSALPVLGAMAVHGWAWQHGTHGSAGLLRVIVTVLPLAALFTLFTLGRGAMLLFRERPRLSWILAPALFLALAGWSISDLVLQFSMPVHRSLEQEILDKAGDLIAQRLPPDRKLWSSHPYLPFRAGIDTFDPERFGMFYAYNADVVKNSYKPGDLLFWDAQLGSSMEHCPLDDMLADTNLIVRKVLEPFERRRVLGGYLMEMVVYERGRAHRTHTTDTLCDGLRFPGITAFRADTVPGTGGRSIREGEFPLEAVGLPWPSGEHTLFDLFRFDVDIAMPDSANERVVLVYVHTLNGRHMRYDQEEIRPGHHTFWIRLPMEVPDSEQKVYLWNITKHPFQLREFRIVRERWQQQEFVQG